MPLIYVNCPMDKFTSNARDARIKEIFAPSVSNDSKDHIYTAYRNIGSYKRFGGKRPVESLSDQLVTEARRHE